MICKTVKILHLLISKFLFFIYLINMKLMDCLNNIQVKQLIKLPGTHSYK